MTMQHIKIMVMRSFKNHGNNYFDMYKIYINLLQITVCKTL
jgi:hypothetical protein